jgi:hypothetical protein
MKQKSVSDKAPAEQVLKDIRRQTRRQYSACLILQATRRPSTQEDYMPAPAQTVVALIDTKGVRQG